MIKILVLLENTSASSALTCRHGFSLYMETETRRILFDMGPDGTFLKNAEKLGVDADFRFFSRSELLSVLHGADLYVHTACVEIEAIACLEAIVSGLVPVINDSPRSATKAFALDGNNLFKLNNVDDLKNKIEFWRDNPDLIKEYKSRYKSIIGSFDQEECMKKMEEMLLSAIEMKNGKSQIL